MNMFSNNRKSGKYNNDKLGYFLTYLLECLLNVLQSHCQNKSIPIKLLTKKYQNNIYRFVNENFWKHSQVTYEKNKTIMKLSTPAYKLILNDNNNNNQKKVLSYDLLKQLPFFSENSAMIIQNLLEMTASIANVNEILDMKSWIDQTAQSLTIDEVYGLSLYMILLMSTQISLSNISLYKTQNVRQTTNTNTNINTNIHPNVHAKDATNTNTNLANKSTNNNNTLPVQQNKNIPQKSQEKDKKKGKGKKVKWTTLPVFDT